jgi:putative chitinase
MSEWKEFLRDNDRLATILDSENPAPILINFVNRYLEPLDSIMYRIDYDGKTIRGLTTSQSHSVEVAPLSFRAVRVLVWSKLRGEFKMIAELAPRRRQRLLVSLRLKTFRHLSRTEAHPLSKKTDDAGRASGSANTAGEAGRKWEITEQGVESAETKNKKDEPEHMTKRTTAETILVGQLKKIFPAADEKYLGTVADELNADLEKYKLDTALRRAHFFAQVRQEAGASLSPRQESLNYRPEVLIEKFSYYRKRPEEAHVDGRLEEVNRVEKKIGGKKSIVDLKTTLRPADQLTIANKAYAKRDGNGDVSSGHGWKYRGRGIFQLTLRTNYERFTNQYSSLWSGGKIDFLSEPDKVCEFPYFIRSAVWFWVSKSIYVIADGGAADENIDLITEKVNGDAKDAADQRRKNFHELCYPAFK